MSASASDSLTIQTVYRVGSREFTDRAEAEAFAAPVSVGDYAWYVVYTSPRADGSGFEALHLVGAPSGRDEEVQNVVTQYAIGAFRNLISKSTEKPVLNWQTVPLRAYGKTPTTMGELTEAGISLVSYGDLDGDNAEEPGQILSFVALLDDRGRVARELDLH